MTVRSFSVAKDILRFEGTAPAQYWQRFALLLALAVVIATMGLIRDSGPVVIAAMLIAPLMTPILGIAAALVTGRTRRFAMLTFRVLLSAVICVLLAWCLVFLADVPRGILIPQQVLSRTDPGIEDLVVALASGVAGAYVQIQKSQISLLPGAAIGVSLVPPLAASGVLLYFGEPQGAIEAALLFVTNLAAIILSASAVYVISSGTHIMRRRLSQIRHISVSLAVVIAVFGLVTFHLGKATLDRYNEGRMEERLAKAIVDWADPVSIEILRLEVKPRLHTADLWLVIDLPLDSQFRVGSVASLLPEELKDHKLPAVFEQVIGPGYQVAIRYQTRIAGVVDLRTDIATPAPAVEEMLDEN